MASETRSTPSDPPIPNIEWLRAEAERAGRDRLRARTARIVAVGRVEVEALPVRAPAEGEVLVCTLLSGISAGTELSMIRGTNPYLHKRWDERLRLFVPPDDAGPQLAFPMGFGYEAVGVCAASRPPPRSGW